MNSHCRTIVGISFLFILSVSLVFNIGCGETPMAPDLWCHLMDTEFSWVIEASPPHFTTATPVDISVTVRPRESGVGHFTIIGENPENGADGVMLSPVTGEMGTVLAPVVFHAGEPTELTWRIQLNEIDSALPYQGVRFQFFAMFDSVMVDSTMYPLGAPELTAAFGSGYLPGFSTLFHLDP